MDTDQPRAQKRGRPRKDASLRAASAGGVPPAGEAAVTAAGIGPGDAPRGGTSSAAPPGESGGKHSAGGIETGESAGMEGQAGGSAPGAGRKLRKAVPGSEPLADEPAAGPEEASPEWRAFYSAVRRAMEELRGPGL